MAQETGVEEGNYIKIKQDFVVARCRLWRRLLPQPLPGDALGSACIVVLLAYAAAAAATISWCFIFYLLKLSPFLELHAHLIHKQLLAKRGLPPQRCLRVRRPYHT